MKKAELIAMGMTEEQADKVIALHKQTLNGEYIPKHRFDDVNEQLTKANDLVKERDKQLTDLSKSTKDVEGLKQQINDLKASNEDAAKKYAADLAETKTLNALKLQLINDELGKPHDVNMVAGLFDRSLLQLDENGNITGGYKEQNERIRKEKEFLFNKVEQKPDGSEQKPNGFSFKGKPPADGGNPPAKDKSQSFGAGLAAKKLGMMGINTQSNNKSE